MNPYSRSFLARTSAAALAVTIGISGFGFQPSVQAAEPAAASSTSASLAYLSDPLRAELVYLNARTENMFLLTDTFTFDPDSYRYHDLIAIQNKTYTLVTDPAASQSELSAVQQQHEKALNDYIDYYLRDHDALRHFATLGYLLYYHSRINQDESKLTPAERGELHAVWDAQARIEQLGGSSIQGNALRAYKEVYLPLSAKADDLETYDASTYSSLIAKYRADIQARLAAISGSPANHSASLQAFEQSTSLLEQIVAARASYNQVKVAKGNLEVRYSNLVNELKLDSPIQNSEEYQDLKRAIANIWTMMDLPKGIRTGEYPPSAFGDLRRALRKAERVLETSTKLPELRQAHNELADAQMDFLVRRKL